MCHRKKECREVLSTDFTEFTFAYEQITNTKTGRVYAKKIWVVDNFTARNHALNRSLLKNLLAQLNVCRYVESIKYLVFQPADSVNLKVFQSEVQQLRDLVDFCLRVFQA